MIYTYTGVWQIIDWWKERTAVLRRRQERAAARRRELEIVRERLAREQSAAAFDRKIALRRGPK